MYDKYNSNDLYHRNDNIYGGTPKVREELHGQRNLDEGMEASFKGTCKLWKVKEVIGFSNLG